MTERISLWRKERLRIVKQSAIPDQVAGSLPCPGSAACIIATIWLLELR
jgi:hypothetical protein